MARRIQVAIDCHDPDRLAEFWADVLEYEVHVPPDGHATWADFSAAERDAGEAWCRIGDPDGSGPMILFHRVPEAKAGKNRVHLDYWTAGELDDEVARVVALGATEARRFAEEAGYFVVMQDPEGNEFCIGG